MPKSLTPAVSRLTVETMQTDFLALEPTTRNIALAYFRHVSCPHRKQDCVCEAVALAWAWYVRLRAKGRDPADFAVTFARLAAKAVGSGRRVCGRERTHDASSPVCQWRRGFTVSPISSLSHPDGTAFDWAVRDNSQTPIPDQVQFRCDFPSWMRGLSELKKRVVESLALGHRTGDVARAAAVSSARISQMRRELRADYMTFCVDDPKESQDRRPREL
jgi:hypothetical protein